MTATDTSARPLARPGALARFLHRHEGWRGHMLLAPAMILMAAAILFPLGVTLTMSTWSLSGYDVDQTPGLGNYAAMVENPMFRVLILRTLTISLTCTFFTVILVYPMAYFVAFHTNRNKALWLIVLTLPFWTSYLLRVFAWRVVLGYEGVINSGLMSLGVISEPIAALLYSQTAVTIVLAHSWAAFAILPIYVSLEKINRTYLEAAADLGDGPARRFWRITFPLSLPGVVAAFILMFVPTMGEYITPILVGGPDSMMVGNLVQSMFGPMNNWPAGAALAVVMMITIAFAGGVFVLLNKLVQR
ncbi:MAG: ABC transporter permease [Aestuariivita sp.]|uniref:ABC transporter permease n=1 Tax=Aestuariivita sp. TaxID=1872407 RepID=UPI003BB01ADF